MKKRFLYIFASTEILCNPFVDWNLASKWYFCRVECGISSGPELFSNVKTLSQSPETQIQCTLKIENPSTVT